MSRVSGQPQGRVAKLVLIGAVPPVMVKSASNPGGLPIEVFDGLRKALADNRSQFYIDLPAGPSTASTGRARRRRSRSSRIGGAKA